jgi:hypothetical protein
VLDALRRFIADTPVLQDLLQQAIHKKRGNATNTEEQRFYIEEIHVATMKELKEGRRMYGVRYNPDFENHCPICRKTFHGTYFELNNAATGKAIVSSIRLIHALVDHEQTFFQELMLNVSGTRVGEMRLVLDLKAINKVLEGADVPDEVLAEAREALTIQQQQLAEADAAAAH